MKTWWIRSQKDAQAFWLKVREVPGRTEGRTKKQYERHYVGLYLLALAEHGPLAYPLKVEEGESPDFILKWESGETTGLEVTSATTQALQRWIARADKEHPDGAAVIASPLGYAESLEKEWCDSVRRAIQAKLAKLPSFRPASSHDLLVVDDTATGPGDRGDHRKVLSWLGPWVRQAEQENPVLGRISIVVSLDVLFDVGGESRILPYIEWSAADSDAAQMETFSDRVEHAGRVAAARVIREHRTAGRPIYFTDSKGRLVKETSDGRRFEVQVGNEGEETNVGELPRS